MNQKEEEKLVMSIFRKKFEDFPKGKLISSESPDFILKVNPKKSIGIELTRLSEYENLVEALVDSMDKKEKKISLYQGQGFVKLWLVIYSDDLSRKNSYNFINKISNLSFQTSFDKVFLFDLFEAKEYLIK